MTFASNVNGSLIIPAHWQSAWNAMYNVMTLVGSLVAAESIDWFGCRFGFLFTAITAAAGVALNFVARNPAEFLGGKMITGFAVGIAMTVGQKYVSEIAPLRMRGIALSFNTICMVSLPQPEARGGSNAGHHLTLSLCAEPRLPHRHLCDV
jgi:MFS family permease